MGLYHAGKRQSKCHKAHGRGHYPEAPHIEDLIIGLHPTQLGHGVGDDGQHHHHIGTIESQVTVGSRDLGAVGVVVDERQGVHKTPDTGPEKRHSSTAQRPEHGSLIRMVATSFPEHVEGKQHHGKERQHFKGGENTADGLPVPGCADPVVMMAGSQETGKQGQSDNDV